ncbi:MAG TPA: hypothetical protein VGH91_12560 [Gammaproteobacteria bacterium]|jgi:hypothetical protein
MATRAFVYSRGQSVNFMVDTMMSNLKEVILENGHDPAELMNDAETTKRGIRAWIESGDLEMVTLEFYAPGSSKASARWDFPIVYSGSGVDDDLWADKSYLRGIVAKSTRPKPGDKYSVLLFTKQNRPDVDGFTRRAARSTDHMTATSAGTVIATGHLTASTRYWK